MALARSTPDGERGHGDRAQGLPGRWL